MAAFEQMRGFWRADYTLLKTMSLAKVKKQSQ